MIESLKAKLWDMHTELEVKNQASKILGLFMNEVRLMIGIDRTPEDATIQSLNNDTIELLRVKFEHIKTLEELLDKQTHLVNELENELSALKHKFNISDVVKNQEPDEHKAEMEEAYKSVNKDDKDWMETLSERLENGELDSDFAHSPDK